ncbi:MAG TPA: dihydrolipoamide acetyltransferase family protein, partial [Actinomycetes bacterium]|nr:dihydrolipoamide acetyltransferase family protein [Actinomycetes bacterium]
DVLAEIETDKATMELEAFEEGVLQQILVKEGETVPIGQPIAIVGAGGASAPAAAPAQPAPGAAPPSPAEQAAKIETTPEVETSTAAAEAAAASAAAPAAAGEPVKASPMARAIARDQGIDLSTVTGSGPGGRVVKADVEALAAGDGGRAAPAAAPAAPAVKAPAAAQPAPGADVEEIPLTSMRKTVARRLVESMQSAPHFYLTIQVDVEALLGLRAELNQRLADEGVKLSVNDLLIKACAVTLRAHPDINVSWAGDKILRHRRVHVGIAVAVDGGLIVPVVRDTDQKSVSQISKDAKALIERARIGKLRPEDYTGGTFTISNLGMFGIDQFTAVINPPEAAILAVGTTSEEPIVRDGQLATRQRMKLTLSIDHRALDGATGAQFLAALKATLEEPLRILA